MGLSPIICSSNVVAHWLYGPFIPPQWHVLTSSSDDSPAHISEEVANAAFVGPIAILTSVALVGSMGWILLIAASFASASVPGLLETNLALPFGQLLLNILGKRGMLVIWSLTLIAQASYPIVSLERMRI